MTAPRAPLPSPALPAKVLAIDPGRDKCGVAVVVDTGTVLTRRIFLRREIQHLLEPLVQQHAITQIVLGNATTSRGLLKNLQAWLPEVPVALVDETGSTLEARALYWETHRPTGWRRFLPLSLQTPPEPIDDFAAVVLARRFFAGG